MASSNKSAESIAAFQEGIDRLAAYEDLGVTPDQIRQIDGLCSEPAKEMGRMAKTRMCRGKYWTGGSSGHYEEAAYSTSGAAIMKNLKTVQGITVLQSLNCRMERW